MKWNVTLPCPDCDSITLYTKRQFQSVHIIHESMHLFKPTVVRIMFDMRRFFREKKCHTECAIIVLIYQSKKNKWDYIHFFTTIPSSEILAIVWKNPKTSRKFQGCYKCHPFNFKRKAVQKDRKDYSFQMEEELLH